MGRPATNPSPPAPPCLVCLPTSPCAQIGNMVLHGMLAALGLLEAAAAGEQQLPPLPPPLEAPWEEEGAEQRPKGRQRARGGAQQASAEPAA